MSISVTGPDGVNTLIHLTGALIFPTTILDGLPLLAINIMLGGEGSLDIKAAEADPDTSQGISSVLLGHSHKLGTVLNSLAKMISEQVGCPSFLLQKLADLTVRVCVRSSSTTLCCKYSAKSFGSCNW